MKSPPVLDCLLGQRVRVRVLARDYDGELVTPTEIVARVGIEGTEPAQVDVTIHEDGAATFEVEATTVGNLAYQVNVTQPIAAVEHGTIRVHEPVFGEAP